MLLNASPPSAAGRGEGMSDQRAGDHFAIFGCALAICISYSANQSILWAMLHGLCSWFYVIYYAIFY
jgi:hypothetical protein